MNLSHEPLAYNMYGLAALTTGANYGIAAAAAMAVAGCGAAVLLA